MRRTKEESERTRQSILAAARKEFACRGVTRTTLDHIARAAGVTRGAIYWHFANKHELFHAMRDQVSLPLVDRIDIALQNSADDPLAGIEHFLLSLLDAVASDARTRSTFEILHLKCEYVDELAPELARQTAKCHELQGKLTLAYQRGEALGQLRGGLDPSLAGLATCAFVTGLIRLWLLDHDGSLVRHRVPQLIQAHMESHRIVAASRAAADFPAGAARRRTARTAVER